MQAFRMSDERFLLRGAIVDEKPAGLYIENDPDPIWMHHMIVEMQIVYPTFLIEKASVEFKNHPHLGCTNITDHYKKLEGMSIARGFNAKVRELFGSSRGCTHIGALLAAMAPVAIQTGWSMRVSSVGEIDDSSKSPEDFQEQRIKQFASTINTCHIWDENGAMIAKVRAGEEIEMPLPVVRRLRDLGRDETDWLAGRK
ncbi:hypothetical protein GM51_18325 [freshwater metagenome]|uniref:DUF2889 domain-containing protein n=1 Tax=freshwater metagenome TaxID=449393 RepID=A0A094PQJ8_9ZZZZ